MADHHQFDVWSTYQSKLTNEQVRPCHIQQINSSSDTHEAIYPSRRDISSHRACREVRWYPHLSIPLPAHI